MEPGLEHSRRFTVAGDLTTTVGGALARPVLATPKIVQLMEWTSVDAVRGRLPQGTTSVGFEVCIKHVGASAEGASCTVHAKLREVVDGRKLRFDVEVREGERTIAVGTHERRLIDL